MQLENDAMTAGQNLIREGVALLAAGKAEEAAQVLLRARSNAHSRLAAHDLIEQHGLNGSFGNIMGVNCTVSTNDDIFRFFAGHHSSQNPLRDYFADGWRTLSELMWFLEEIQRPLANIKTILEFASGHGRFTRHLVKACGAQRVTVADVVPDAVDFCKAIFNINGFLSTTVPEDLVVTSRHELVFVLSLFSHLPRVTWGRWLKKLYEMVEPGGVLLFSTHGIKAAQYDNVALDGSGFFFAPASESNAIDVNEYGTCFTSPAFVHEQIAQFIEAEVVTHSRVLQFWNHQDAYALVKPKMGA